MNTSQAKRNVRALLIFGFIFTLVASVGGAAILALGYSRQTVTKPIWEFGQTMMILGLVNLGIYVCIFFQVRRAFSEFRDDHAA